MLPLIVAPLAVGAAQPPAASGGSASAAATRSFPGILLPGKTALIKSKYDELVSEVFVDVGMRVTQGQLMLRLADNEERVRLARAEALLHQARADHERTQELHAEDLTSDDALETAETNVRIAQADVDLARVLLHECEVRAPFNGIVTERMVDAGASVEVGDDLICVCAQTPLRFEALLPETMLSSFAGPTEIELVPSFPDTVIRRAIGLTTLVVDPASGTFPLRIDLENVDATLVSGVSCEVRVPLRAQGEP